MSLQGTFVQTGEKWGLNGKNIKLNGEFPIAMVDYSNRGFLQMSLLAAEVQYIPELRSELFNCLVYPELWISRLDRWHLSQTCNHVWWGRAEVEDNIYSYIFRSHSTGEHTGSIPFNSVLRCVKWRFHPKQAGLPSNKFMGCWPERTSKTKNGNNCWHPKM